MPSVSIHPPKTPVTKGSTSIAAATVPNVCKMPGPPAPFVPTPLPNIGKSGMSPQGYSTTVKIEGQPVAIMGASFKSMGDVASKGTGGGMVSMNCEGPTKFIAPGSLTVKIQGKNVHLLSDVMSNNNGPAGSPPNAATLMGAVHSPGTIPELETMLCEIWKKCDSDVDTKHSAKRETAAECWSKADGTEPLALKLGREKHECCKAELNKRKSKGSGDLMGSLEPERKMPLEAGGSVRVDVMVTSPKKAVYDFKFQCPKSDKAPKWPQYRNPPVKGKRKAPAEEYDKMTQDQLIEEATGVEPDMINENTSPCKS